MPRQRSFLSRLFQDSLNSPEPDAIDGLLGGNYRPFTETGDLFASLERLRGPAAGEEALVVRRLVHAASVAARREAESASARGRRVMLHPPEGELPSLEECARQFVPTALSLGRATHEGVFGFRAEFDDPMRPRFLRAVYLSEGAGPHPRGRATARAARAYLGLPGLEAETGRQADRVESARPGLPLPLTGPEGGGALTGLLTAAERRGVRGLPLDEQIALVALLAGGDGLVAAVSRAGTWPASPLLLQVATRLNRRIIRCRTRSPS